VDYAFAPNADAYIGRVRAMFQRRANTTLIHQRRITTVRQFISHLDTTGSITKPIGDILLGAHANSEGHIFVDMFPGQSGSTKYETLEQTLTSTARSVRIPDTVIGYTTGDPLTHFVHFKGCNIGKVPRYLAKFKEALGDHVNVTAPKHFHGSTPVEDVGYFEYMAYEFEIFQKDAFADRATAVTAFENAGFKRVDGSAMPQADWANLIPARIDRTTDTQIASTLGVAIGGTRTILTPRQFRLRNVASISRTIQYADAGSVPSSDADRRQELERVLRDDPRNAAGHAFPWYERLGYTSFANFFAGYTWTCRPNRNRLVCSGVRHEYTVVVPITDVATGNLIFNFYPNAGSGHAAVTTGLQTTDAKFFAST
jgi:hypothetical protein